jgi:hypothetical protein
MVNWTYSVIGELSESCYVINATNNYKEATMHRYVGL